MSSKDVDRIDSYYEVGKRSALICVVIGLILSMFLILISFILPFYVSTPYAGYDINYYYNQVKYSPDIHGDIAFSKCENNSYNQNCNELTQISSNIIGINVTTVLLITIICVIMLRIVISKQKFITNTFILFNLLSIILCWGLTTISIHSYMKTFPNTRYCSYNGNDTGCKWFTGITILLSCTCILCILTSVLIGLIAPFCKIFKFLPWLGGANDDIDTPRNERLPINENNINSMRDDESINDYHHKPLIGPNNQHYNPQNRRKYCAYLTIPEWCSIIILAIGLVLINIMLILSYFNEWYPSDYQSQTYVNNKWNTAQCVDLNGYKNLTPIIYNITEQNDNQCSFSYPDSNNNTQYHDTYWSCCDINTCQKAFDYKSLMIGYNYSNTNANSNKCLIDMNAMIKASCHPNDKWFVYDQFNISQTPKQKVNKESKLVICALFCKQTYDHCMDMKWTDNNMNKTVKEIWNRFDEFCEEGLGVEIRYEAFTDRCFAGCVQYKVDYIIIFVVIIVIWLN
eukprot:406056_1